MFIVDMPASRPSTSPANGSETQSAGSERGERCGGPDDLPDDPDDGFLICPRARTERYVTCRHLRRCAVTTSSDRKWVRTSVHHLSVNTLTSAWKHLSHHAERCHELPLGLRAARSREAASAASPADSASSRAVTSRGVSGSERCERPDPVAATDRRGICRTTRASSAMRLPRRRRCTPARCR